MLSLIQRKSKHVLTCYWYYSLYFGTTEFKQIVVTRIQLRNLKFLGIFELPIKIFNANSYLFRQFMYIKFDEEKSYHILYIFT